MPAGEKAGTRVSKEELAIRWMGDMLVFSRFGIIVDVKGVRMSPRFAKVVSKWHLPRPQTECTNREHYCFVWQKS